MSSDACSIHVEPARAWPWTVNPRDDSNPGATVGASLSDAAGAERPKFSAPPRYFGHGVWASSPAPWMDTKTPSEVPMRIAPSGPIAAEALTSSAPVEYTHFFLPDRPSKA